MKKTFYLIVLVILILGSTMAFAQQPVVIDKIYLELRPEYDRPEMLVVYTIALNEELSYPVEFSIRIPASAGGPSVVWEVVDGQPIATTYASTLEGEWISVNIQSSSSVVYLDYYDSALLIENDKRNYSFKYPPGLDAEAVELLVWQPPNSEKFLSSIILPQQFLDEQGNIFHVVNLQSEQLGNFKLDLSYSLIETTSEDNSLSFSWGDVLPWLLGIIGLAILVYGVYNMSFRSKKNKKLGRKRSRSTKDVKKIKGKSKFCHNCGENMNKNDKFCSECGERNR